MIEESHGLEGKVFELSMRLQQVEHDLSHVVIERDRAQQKVDLVQKLLEGVAHRQTAWYDPKDTHDIIHKAKKILRGPK